MATPALDNDVIISLKGVGKRYILRKSKPFLFWEALKRLHRRRPPQEAFWALQDINVTIRAGETVGIIGKNGAGKSTLLGILSGAITPTTGSVAVRGRIGALLELGAGFHADLTGRENIFLNASLLGLGEEETRDLLDRIIEFSELQEFIDVPIRNYSSGMHVRLGFSVAIHSTPDLLIMDEALAVGDWSFQQKCIQRVQELLRMNKTMLFVSHGLDQVQQLCQRALWLEHGRLVKDGPAGEVVEAYHKHA